MIITTSPTYMYIIIYYTTSAAVVADPGIVSGNDDSSQNGRYFFSFWIFIFIFVLLFYYIVIYNILLSFCTDNGEKEKTSTRVLGNKYTKPRYRMAIKKTTAIPDSRPVNSARYLDDPDFSYCVDV